jgi:spermidine/putrescine transport system permease protein
MNDVSQSLSDYEQAARQQETRRNWLLCTPALVVLVLAASGPLLVMLFYSFLKSGNYGGVIYEFSLDGWFNVILVRDIFDDVLRFADAHLSVFWRSIKLSAMTTITCVIIGFPTAYFIATRPRRSRNFWLNLLIRTFAILELIRNNGVINNLLMDLWLIDEPIQIMYTDTAIMIGMTYVYLPLMILPLYASMEKLDFQLVEAAYDLYATRIRVLRRVIIPLIKPGIVAGSILVFIPSLGAFVTPRVLGGGKNLMLGNLIQLQFDQGQNWPLGAALSITLLAIVMVTLLVYVRYSQRSGGQDG